VRASPIPTPLAAPASLRDWVAVSGLEDRANGRPGAPPAAPREDLMFIGLTATIMSVILVFNALNVTDEATRAGHPLEAWEPFVWEGSSGLVILSMTPLLLALTRRAWPLTSPWAPKLAIHALAALAFSFVHILVAGGIRWAVYVALRRHYDAFGPLKDWPYELRKDVLIYATLVALYVIWRLLRAPAPAAGTPSDEVLEVRDGARRHFVPLAEVLWVEAAGNYVELHRGNAGLLHRASLAEMQRRLQAAGFIRIHRSRLVRRDAVAAVESKPTGDFVVRLRDGRELAGSRRYRRPLLAD
jgi:hypothetical protein